MRLLFICRMNVLIKFAFILNIKRPEYKSKVGLHILADDEMMIMTLVRQFSN